ncbi:Release factor glutamine methyltransferase [Buchnera aphidicola (Periphyllus testudinaceus)]|uniref:peptide chain release factor N(5)-glutamine methyltransferase n=1 Tax=Buchnera aphidicola TaxID=9 RepID=UPI003463BBB7
MKIKEWIKKSLECLKNINNSRLDIEVLLSFVLKKSRSWVICFEDYVLKEQEIIILNKLVMRRFYNEPLSYLTYKKEFWSLSFFVSRCTIIPRPDSEILVERSLEIIGDSPFKILDLGTGCGNIAISIAFSKPNCLITGVDYSIEIIKVALYNSKKLNIKNVNFFVSDWFSLIHKNKYDIIVSNPPYISLKEFCNLTNEIFYEPILSLVSENNGFSDIIIIIKNSKNYLNNKGWLLLEHGWNQKREIQILFKKYNYINVKTYKDYSGLNRVTIGQILKF